jgi:hypothetical protein
MSFSDQSNNQYLRYNRFPDFGSMDNIGLSVRTNEVKKINANYFDWINDSFTRSISIVFAIYLNLLESEYNQAI